MAKPGVVLRRGVGTSGDFEEDAELPDLAAIDNVAKPYAADKPASPRDVKRPHIEKADRAANAKAARFYDANVLRREREQPRAAAL